MQQSHFWWNDLQLLWAALGFAINESETQTKYTNGVGAENTKASPNSPGKTHLPSSALPVPHFVRAHARTQEKKTD